MESEEKSPSMTVLPNAMLCRGNWQSKLSESEKSKWTVIRRDKSSLLKEMMWGPEELSLIGGFYTHSKSRCVRGPMR